MKKVVLSVLTAGILSVGLNATEITLYQDKTTGALYTTPGENRIKLGKFVSKDEISKDISLKMQKEAKITKVVSKVPTLKINGVHYLGFTGINYKDDRDDVKRFESRRNYFQVKAYWNEKDYVRMTLDTHQDDTGDWKVRLKYAYLYLSGVLPYTGVEFGQVHRPWIDWEEHHGWLYRSIAKTFVEEHNGAHLTNSADLGINFKTKTENFSSEIGLYNGEGYHGKIKENKELSFEWRLTAHLFGTGREHVKSSTEYLDVSFLGQINSEYKNDPEDFKWYGIHAVYNQPLFLLAAMYVKSDHENKDDKEGKGFSVNGELRPVPKWSVFARYDKWSDEHGSEDKDREEWIAGLAYKYNKNVKFIANVFGIDPDTDTDDDEELRYMLTSEIKW